MSGVAVATTAHRVAGWLLRENGTGPLEQVLQAVAKPLEELEEVLEALDEGDDAGAAEECADIIVTARVAQVGLLGEAGIYRWQDDAGTPLNRDQRVRLLVAHIAGLGRHVVAWQQQNPRKPRLNPEDAIGEVALQLDQVAVAASHLIRALGYDVDAVLDTVTARINRRLDEAGVPA